ncbi:MAG: class I SAM-dependent methyltransferase [Candidatus Sumerlaeia bacterium]|nr:class I SAM-dependent methyltransferase [Candidatus Sumerlaeia bacterium]
MSIPEKPWYETAFGEDYLRRYAHRDEDEARHGVALLARQGDIARGRRVLDLCCGAGRHLGPLDTLGGWSMGGDLSMALLREATATHPVVRLDMRHLPFLNESFAVVSNFFTAFGYFDEDEENLSVFAEVHRVLEKGGWFFLDFMNVVPVIRELEGKGGRDEGETVDGQGRRWHVTRLLTRGPRVEKKMVSLESPCGSSISESVRLFREMELVEGLNKVGFVVQKRYGSYLGDDFDEVSSPRLILVACKAK